MPLVIVLSAHATVFLSCFHLKGLFTRPSGFLGCDSLPDCLQHSPFHNKCSLSFDRQQCVFVNEFEGMFPELPDARQWNVTSSPNQCKTEFEVCKFYKRSRSFLPLKRSVAHHSVFFFSQKRQQPGQPWVSFSLPGNTVLHKMRAFFQNEHVCQWSFSLTIDNRSMPVVGFIQWQMSKVIMECDIQMNCLTWTPKGCVTPFWTLSEIAHVAWTGDWLLNSESNRPWWKVHSLVWPARSGEHTKRSLMVWSLLKHARRTLDDSCHLLKLSWSMLLTLATLEAVQFWNDVWNPSVHPTWKSFRIPLETVEIVDNCCCLLKLHSNVQSSLQAVNNLETHDSKTWLKINIGHQLPGLAGRNTFCHMWAMSHSSFSTVSCCDDNQWICVRVDVSRNTTQSLNWLWQMLIDKASPWHEPVNTVLLCWFTWLVQRKKPIVNLEIFYWPFHWTKRC